jgi:CubicO group peptidase (beta-lactamase class C family)
MRNSRYLGFVLIAVLLGLLASLPSRAAAPEQTPADRLAAVENDIPPPVVVAGEPVEKWSIEKQLERYKVPAVSVAVINDYKIDWVKAWGVTESGGKQVATKDTLFQAASISKPIAAMAVLHLVQEGKLNLDTSVNDYLKHWKLPDNQFTRIKPVTLRELLTHSAGIPTIFHPRKRDLMIPTLTEMLEGVPPATNPPVTVQWVPGSKWEYSNAGYGVVQQVVEDVTGESFPDFMKNALLQPLGMKHSTYVQPLPAALEKDAAMGTISDGSELPGKLAVTIPSITGELSTTPSDIAKFAIALMNTGRGRGNPVISAATGAEMLKWKMITAGGSGQGLGVFRFTSSKSMGQGFSHTGDGAGFKNIMTGYLSGRGIIVMTNGDNGMAVALPVIRAVEHVYGWKTYVAPSE